MVVPAPRTLAEVSEGALLAEILPLYGSSGGLVVGPGDDAAVVRTGSSVVATTDSMVRGRDGLDEWSSASDVAVKVLTQNLADVAAMGAVPTAVLVALVADPALTVDWAVELARALGEGATRAGVDVAGGDLSSAPPGTVVVSLTALGDLRGGRPVLRSGARPGDTVAVCGTLGRSAAGLALLRSGARPAAVDRGTAASCVAHHLRPSSPLEAGPRAARAGATAMVDVSDGLLRDGSRVAAASGVRLDLSGDLLSPDVEVLRAVVGEQAEACVLAGGEEHSLLATFRGPLPDGWRPLGRVVEGSGVALDGEVQEPRGWDHFGG